MAGIRGRITVIAEVIEALHHGGEKSGNEVLHRTEPFYHGGLIEDVPIVSGNSFKHLNREGAAMFALAALGLLPEEDEEGKLGNAELNLLISGGTLTKSGQSIRLDEARKAELALPVLGLHGYACGNVMQEAQAVFSNLTLACDSTAHLTEEVIERLAPAYRSRLEDTPDDFLESYFGTNHEPTRRRAMRDLLYVEDRKAIEKQVSDDKDAGVADRGRKSTQMIYSYQCLVPGSVLVGSITLKNGLRHRELQALRSGFWWPSEGQGPNGGILLRLGGKGSVGRGLVEMRFFGELAEGLQAPRMVGTQEIAPVAGLDDEALQTYAEGLKSAGAMEALKELLK